MFGMPVALTHFGAFTNVSCFRSLSTRALACDMRKGRSHVLAAYYFLLGLVWLSWRGWHWKWPLGMDGVSAHGYSDWVEGLPEVGTRATSSCHITSAGRSCCRPLSWRSASESAVSLQRESSVAYKVTSGIQTKGHPMMPTGHCALRRSEKGQASRLCSRRRCYTCCEKTFQFESSQLKAA